MTATTVKARKAKGRSLQNRVAADIRSRFSLSENDVRPAVMGTSGIDILLSDDARERYHFGTECKFTESLNIRESLRQTEANALAAGLTPLLVFKWSRSKIYAVIEWRHLLELIGDERKSVGDIHSSK